MSPLNAGSLRFIGEKFVYFGGGAVVGHDVKAVVVHIEDQVLAHDCEADQGNVTGRSTHSSGCDLKLKTT